MSGGNVGEQSVSGNEAEKDSAVKTEGSTQKKEGKSGRRIMKQKRKQTQKLTQPI